MVWSEVHRCTIRCRTAGWYATVCVREVCGACVRVVEAGVCAFAVLFGRDQAHIVMVMVECRGVVRGA